MNILLLEPGEIDGDGRVTLADRRAEHVRQVLRAELGQELRVAVLERGRGVGRVAALDGKAVTLEVALDPGDREQAPTIDLVLALPRPQVLHRSLQYATVFGVGRIDLIRSLRVEKSYFSSPSLEPAEIRRQLLLGAEQGRSSRLPEVGVHPRFGPFLETLEAAPPATCWLAHNDAELTVEQAFAALRPEVQADAGAPWRLAIGPEGGWVDSELRAFAGLGFQPVRLGPWVLKVEMAVAALLAQLDLLRRQAAEAARRA